jgi:Tfp pilus assembly protein PilF
MHPDLADTLSNLARVYRVLGDYTQAEALYERAISILTHALGEEHPRRATVLNNKAFLCRVQKRYAEALLKAIAMTLFVNNVDRLHFRMVRLLMLRL